MATRRRGKELEDAILQAAWSLFTRDGFTAVTMQQVAADAGTSKPVLYRRWPDRNALLKDAIAFGLHALSPATPNTGSVRGDLVAFMTDINRTPLPSASTSRPALTRPVPPRPMCNRGCRTRSCARFTNSSTGRLSVVRSTELGSHHDSSPCPWISCASRS